MKSKIIKSEFKREWGTGLKKLFYHDVTFENESKAWNIGAKAQNPDFLSVGQELNYEITDSDKRKIKRVQAEEPKTKFTGGGGRYANATPPIKAVSESTSLIRALDKYNEEDIVFLDIETVRGVNELTPGSALAEAWAYKARYQNEVEKKTGEPMTAERYFIEKAALYAPFAKVVCIVVGRITVDGGIKMKSYIEEKESDLLKSFNNDINNLLAKNPKTIFCGWVNKTFDEPFLAKRMIVRGIQPNILLDNADKKPWLVNTIDLCELWQGPSFYRDSLQAVAVTLGLKSPKINMDGSQVSEAYYAGKIDDVAAYCGLDVLTTANVYRKFVNKPIVTLSK